MPHLEHPPLGAGRTDDLQAHGQTVGGEPAGHRQRRAAAQLADITAGDRQELAELLVAVRTLRGLRRRRQARRIPRPGEQQQQ